jgi:hypothetical protein
MKKLLKLVLVVGGIAAVAKVVTAKKAEWQGMSEASVRAKLDEKLPDKVPADKRAEIADKVVGKMREKGVLAEDAPVAEAPASD